jgi:hypothetical protein
MCKESLWVDGFGDWMMLYTGFLMLVSSEFDFLDCLIKSDPYSDCLQASLRKKVCTLSLSSSDS